MTPWPRWTSAWRLTSLTASRQTCTLTGRVSLDHTPLSQQGLSARPQSLDATLTDLRLSPFPSLVIGVEGATEYTLVPRVLDLLEIELDRNWISIIDFGGTDRDLSLLARYAGEPVLGRDLGSGVALERPITRFLILTDAEHKYATVKDRNYQRKLLLDSLTQNVPADLRGDYYSNKPESRTVEIRTWGRDPFEFAHFTDLQLAKTMMDNAKVPYPHARHDWFAPSTCSGPTTRHRTLMTCSGGEATYRRPSLRMPCGRCWRSELPRVFRTGNLRLIHAASCPFRYSSMTSCGVR